MKINITGQSSSGGTISTQDEGVPLSSTVTTLNFTGAGVTASGAGATTTVNIAGGAGTFSVTEVEIDFGSTPTYDKTFTVTNASISAASKIMVTQSGNNATGQGSGDSLWDDISYSADGAAGTFTLYAHAEPGPVSGKRNVFYTFS